jgi:hypothetical protein
LAKNDRLQREIQLQMEQAQALYQQSGEAARVFHQFHYQTRTSWSRARRVVAKAEYLEKGENPRFIVTSLTAQGWPAQPLYEEHYCARGGDGKSHQRVVSNILCKRWFFVWLWNIPQPPSRLCECGKRSLLCIFA